MHRSLGVHISQPRSLTLDEWKVEHVDYFKNIMGNERANAFWEFNLNNKSEIVASINAADPKAARLLLFNFYLIILFLFF